MKRIKSSHRVKPSQQQANRSSRIYAHKRGQHNKKKKKVEYGFLQASAKKKKKKKKRQTRQTHHFNQRLHLLSKRGDIRRSEREED